MNERHIDPRFFTDDIAEFASRMAAYAEEQGVSRQKIRKVVKFLERVTAPYQHLDEVFLRFMPSSLRQMDPATTTIEQDKMNIIAMALWDLYHVQWAHDCKRRNAPDPKGVESFLDEFRKTQREHPEKGPLASTYSLPFARMLQATFHRGEIRVNPRNGRCLWTDADGTPYGIEGRWSGDASELIALRDMMPMDGDDPDTEMSP